MSEGTRTTGSSEPSTDSYYYAVQPNQMSYTDGDGVSRQIHLPKGSSQDAGQYLIEKDWEALARFPTWTGSPDQQYSEKDFAKIPKGPTESK